MRSLTLVIALLAAACAGRPPQPEQTAEQVLRAACAASRIAEVAACERSDAEPLQCADAMTARKIACPAENAG